MIDLQLSAEVENVQKIGVPRDHTFFIKLRCVNCNDITPSAVGISRDMEVEGVRGASVNMQIKCKGCSRVNDISIVDEDGGEFVADSDKWQTIASFECRGVDLHEYEVRDGYYVVAADGKTRFEDADLSDDWCEVDEKGRPVSVSQVAGRFVAGGGKKGDKKKKK
mmetsp:Transcript_32279/g.86109  ORF Transcript_32279/g.86109 Transcript_32279/m.86109 type:complete len:165 (+) Transcript_32279:3-497(+)